MQNIRLTETEIKAIQETFHEWFPPEDHLWLFGSRVYPHKKGGDIDLYCETTYKTAEEVVHARTRFLTNLQMKIGIQKIDMVIKFGEQHLHIYNVARREGVLLV